jgi:23S rRNA G2445 N2-methylase RlmL
MLITDRDKLALQIARTIFTLSFQNNNSNLFFDIKDKFINIDFLKDELPQFDFAILNPPYLSVKKDPKFETSQCADLFAYFLENIIKNSKGFISITPQTFTNGKKYNPLRKLLLDNFEDGMIVWREYRQHYARQFLKSLDMLTIIHYSRQPH